MGLRLGGQGLSGVPLQFIDMRDQITILDTVADPSFELVGAGTFEFPRMLQYIHFKLQY